MTEWKIKKMDIQTEEDCESGNGKKRDWQSSFFSAIYFSKWFVSSVITIGTFRASNTHEFEWAWMKTFEYIHAFCVVVFGVFFSFFKLRMYAANAFGVVSLFLRILNFRKETERKQ